MKVALTCMDIEWENKPVNRDKCVELIKRASLCGARLILFPEMTLTGFTMNVEKCGEEYPYESMDFFLELSNKYSIGIGFGYIEKVGLKGKNHFALVDQGTLLSDYVKIHPFSYGNEDEYYEAGTELVSGVCDDMNFGMFICYDLRFPEIFMESAKVNNVLAVIANWPQPRVKQWEALLVARAIETQSIVLGVNRMGDGGGLHYDKSTFAIDSYGEKITPVDEQKVGQDQVLIFELDLESASDNRSGFPVHKDRKPSLYQTFYKE